MWKLLRFSLMQGWMLTLLQEATDITPRYMRPVVWSLLSFFLMLVPIPMLKTSTNRLLWLTKQGRGGQILKTLFRR